MPTAYSHWAPIRESFQAQARTLAAEQWWQRARAMMPALRAFGCIDDVVVFAQKARTDDEKARRNGVLRALLSIYQGRACTSPWADSPLFEGTGRPTYAADDDPVSGKAGRAMALSVLWLAMWRAIDEVHYRYRNVAGDELASELAEVVLIRFSRADTCEGAATSSNLLMSIARDMCERSKAAHRAAEQERLVDFEGDDVASDAREGTLSYRFRATEAIAPTALEWSMDADTRARRMISDLSPIAGQDARLLVAMDVAGYEAGEIAAAVGLSNDATNKRIQRARGLVKKSFAGVQMMLS